MEFWELGWNRPPCWICQYVLNLYEHRVDSWGFYFLVIRAISLRHVFDRIDTRWQNSVLMYPWRGRLNMEAMSISWYAYHQQISWERAWKINAPKAMVSSSAQLELQENHKQFWYLLDQWWLLEPFGPCWVVQLNDFSIGRTGTTIPDRISFMGGSTTKHQAYHPYPFAGWTWSLSFYLTPCTACLTQIVWRSRLTLWCFHLGNCSAWNKDLWGLKDEQAILGNPILTCKFLWKPRWSNTTTSWIPKWCWPWQLDSTWSGFRLIPCADLFEGRPAQFDLRKPIWIHY